MDNEAPGPKPVVGRWLISVGVHPSPLVRGWACLEIAQVGHCETNKLPASAGQETVAARSCWSFTYLSGTRCKMRQRETQLPWVHVF